MCSLQNFYWINEVKIESRSQWILLFYMLLTTTTSAVNEDCCATDHCPTSITNSNKPNFIILLADDLGYGDLVSYGHSSQEWGAVDQLAVEGMRFTQFYSADSLCTPSRAGLLTGRLPIRTGIVGGQRVFVEDDSGGLPKNELTIPELLKDLGYETGMVGKWHLGINAINRTDGSHLPSKHGFDFVGKNLPYTVLWECDESGIFQPEGPNKSSCFLYDGDEIYQQPIHFETLTESLVKDFVNFIQDSKDAPFFFYFSFPHVHTALWASKLFKGNSKRGLFGDNLNEMVWAVSEVVKTLKSHNLDKNTLVLFLSDHGPHIESCKYGGVTGGLKGGKSNSYEGGFRIPAIAWWPGVIAPAQVCHEVLSALDILPTFISLAGGQLPADHHLDGISFDKILTGRPVLSIKSRPIFFYCDKHLMAVRIRNYKVHYFTSKMFLSSDIGLHCPSGLPVRDWYVNQFCLDEDIEQHDPLVFNLEVDPYEEYPLSVSDKNWFSILEEAKKVVKEHKDSLEIVPDQLGKFSTNVIPCCEYPKCTCNYP